MDSATNDTQQQQMNVQFIVETLLRRRWFVIIPAVTGLIASVVLAFVLPRVYEASSTVAVNNRRIIDPLVSDLAVSPNSLREELNTLSRQILAWPKLEQLVAELKLAEPLTSQNERERFIQGLKQRVRVEPRGNELIQIVFQDSNPAQAQQVVNLLTQSLIDENARIKREEARNAIEFLSDQLSIYRSKLEDSEQNFSVSKVDADLRTAENRRELLQGRLDGLQRLVPSQVTMEANPAVAQLLIRLGQMEAEHARLIVDAKPGNPKIVELQKQIAEVKARIDAERTKDTVSSSVSMANPAYLQVEQELKQVEMDIQYLAKRKAELERRGIEGKNVTEEQLANLGRSRQVDENIYQMLLRQMESAYVSERLQDSDKGGRFAVIEYARLPIDPVKPKPPKVIFMGLMAGLGAGVGLAFLLENMDKSFRTIEDAKQSLSIPLLGSISRIVSEQEAGPTLEGLTADEEAVRFLKKHRILSKIRLIPPVVARKMVDTVVASHVIMLHQPRSRAAEEYRMVHTRIHGFEFDTPLRSMMVTSALKGEGKSTTAANLAVTLANKGKRTVLVDCDLRRGTAHTLFGCEQNPGTADVLTGETALRDACVSSAVANLSLLPRGKATERPFELLGSRELKKMVEELKEMYEVVLLDAPPVLNLPDASLLAESTDGVILVIQAERTQRKDVATVINTLEHAHARVLGYVLTNTSYYMPRYVYDYYYGEHV